MLLHILFVLEKRKKNKKKRKIGIISVQDVKFYTGVKEFGMESLHFRGLIGCFHTRGVSYFTGVNASGMQSLYFRGLGLTISHYRCDFFHICEQFCIEKLAY